MVIPKTPTGAMIRQQGTSDTHHHTTARTIGIIEASSVPYPLIARESPSEPVPYPYLPPLIAREAAASLLFATEESSPGMPVVLTNSATDENPAALLEMEKQLKLQQVIVQDVMEDKDENPTDLLETEKELALQDAIVQDVMEDKEENPTDLLETEKELALQHAIVQDVMEDKDEHRSALLETEKEMALQHALAQDVMEDKDEKPVDLLETEKELASQYAIVQDVMEDKDEKPADLLEREKQLALQHAIVQDVMGDKDENSTDLLETERQPALQQAIVQDVMEDKDENSISLQQAIVQYVTGDKDENPIALQQAIVQDVMEEKDENPTVLQQAIVQDVMEDKDDREVPEVVVSPYSSIPNLTMDSAPTSALIEEQETQTDLEQVLDELEERLQNYTSNNTLQEEQAALQPQVQALEEEKLLRAATKDLLRHLFAICEQQGSEAAWQWARDQVSDGAPDIISLDIPIGETTVTTCRTVRAPESIKQEGIVDLIDRRQLEQAVASISDEYQSELGVFVVRRPYGLETNEKLFELVSETISMQYAEHANVLAMSNDNSISKLEVAVTISADNSLLLLYNAAAVRYRTNPYGGWTTVPNVNNDNGNGPALLGTVSYIDSDANEAEYSLDDILQQALMVRDQYNQTVQCTALALQKLSKENALDPKDVVVATEAPKTNNGTRKQETPEKPLQRVVEEETVDSGSVDIVAIVLGTIFKTFLGLIRWVLVGLPIRVVKTSVTWLLSLSLLGMVYYYLLESRNLHYLSSDTSYFVNAPGIV
jgi:hypothetical protein